MKSKTYFGMLIKAYVESYELEYASKVVSDSHNRETLLAYLVAKGIDFDDAHSYVWANDYDC